MAVKIEITKDEKGVKIEWSDGTDFQEVMELLDVAMKRKTAEGRGVNLDLEKIKKDWDYYCKETEENEIVDVDLHYSMAMEVGWLINKVEKQQQEIEQYKDLLNKCDLVIKTKKHNMDNRDVYVVDVDDLKEALGGL